MFFVLSILSRVPQYFSSSFLLLLGMALLLDSHLLWKDVPSQPCVALLPFRSWVILGAWLLTRSPQKQWWMLFCCSNNPYFASIVCFSPPRHSSNIYELLSCMPISHHSQFSEQVLLSCPELHIRNFVPVWFSLQFWPFMHILFNILTSCNISSPLLLIF